MTHVVKTTVFLKDMTIFGTMNESYAAISRQRLPRARSASSHALPKTRSSKSK